jgi:hypothetical protein
MRQFSSGISLTRTGQAAGAHAFPATTLSHRLQPRQAKKTASSLNRVDQAKNIPEQLGIIRILFQPNKLDVERIHALRRFGQKFL